MQQKSYTIGVEEEYMLCDPNSYNLTSKADVLYNALDDEQKKTYSYELLLSVFEANTKVHETVSDCVVDLKEKRQLLKDLGSKYDFLVGVSGTHPFALAKEQKFVKTKGYDWVSSQLGYYAKRNVTFGLHIHVGINNNKIITNIMNSLRAWIAPLLAISCNSPFFEGELTGVKSSRTMQFGVFPRTGIQPYFKSYNEYIEVSNKLISNNSIVHSNHNWWKIRVNTKFNTIEFRMCDAQSSLKKNGLIFALVQALVHQSVEDYKKNILIEEFNSVYLDDALWQATRFSIDANIINPFNSEPIRMKDYIDYMVEYCYNKIVFYKNEKYLSDLSNILRYGTEADGQIANFNKSNDLKLLTKELINNVE